ncbi:MAG: sensor histidine kinase, partial [Thermoplasmata archaeon]
MDFEMRPITEQPRDDLHGEIDPESSRPTSAVGEVLGRVRKEPRGIDPAPDLLRSFGDASLASLPATLLGEEARGVTGSIAKATSALEINRRFLELEAESASLRARNEQVEGANRRTRELVTNMSHELRTPLNAIIGFSSLLLAGGGDRLAVDQQEYLAEIRQSSEYLLSLVNDILDIAKVEAGRMDLAPSPFALE